MPPDSPLEQLLAGPTMPGRLAWIGLRPAREMPMLTPNLAVMISGRGIKGDHYDTRQNGARQVTLIAFEDIAAIASFLGKRRYYAGPTASELRHSGDQSHGLEGPALSYRSDVIGMVGRVRTMQPHGDRPWTRRI